MLQGSFDLRFARQDHDCIPGTVSIEPAGERHGNWIGGSGAEVLVLQPDPNEVELWRPFNPLFEAITSTRHAAVARLAGQMVMELARRPDPYARLCLQALALELLVAVARLDPAPGAEPRPPAWLLRVQEVLHDDPATGTRLGEVARIAGVHPAHLARMFRRHFRVSVGGYARQLRVQRAAERIGRSEEPIAAIAIDTGFADQSHLTREFRRAYRTTPAAFRKERAGEH
jgi:AraC family transcriptional regulator